VVESRLPVNAPPERARRYIVDVREKTLRLEREGRAETLDLYSAEALGALAHLWVTVSWACKYSYQFTWLGRPIIQLPEDIVRLQELVHAVQPDVIIETGVAHGGNQVFLASLCRLLGHGRVIGVDIEVRPPNRAALEAHPLYPLITLIEGSSTDPRVLERVRAQVHPGEQVLVILDSNHTKDHVRGELEAYAPLVGIGSYVVVADGVMESLVDVPRAKPDWDRDNPKRAVEEFLARHPEFEPGSPPRPFDESLIATDLVTYWPDGYLRRVR